jgi:hypothetical protein
MDDDDDDNARSRLDAVRFVKKKIKFSFSSYHYADGGDNGVARLICLVMFH